MSRLAQQPGERIDRSRPVTFTFDGRPVKAYAGDTIVSALYAEGRRTFSRSFKYHRPRGELCGCGQCANSLVDADGRPGVRACAEPVADGMRVRHQNAWPSLGFDVMRITDKVGGPFTPVGFYYKTFIRPRRLWPLYEKVLRKAAGLGRLPAHQDEREWQTEYRRRHCDVLVVGGGVAGLSAAVHAAESGLDVVLCDEDITPGGLLLAEGRGDRATELTERARSAGVEVLTRAPALGFFDGLVAVWQGDTLHQIRAAQHVIATGEIQQPLVFDDNDLPGVMLSGGARRLAALYAVKPGERAVVASVDDRGLDDALALHALGVDVRAVADLRAAPQAGDRLAALRAAGIAVVSSATVVRGHGRDRVRAATIARVDARGHALSGTHEKVPCDLLAVSGGAQPALSLLLQAGGRAEYDDVRAGFRVAEVPPGLWAAGALAGHADEAIAELSGQTAGLAAAAACGAATAAVADHARARLDAAGRPVVVAVPPACATDGRRGGKCFVDLDEDVTFKDVAQAVAEGYDSLELSKRYTTVTMGPSQGRFSQVPAARAVADVTGLDLGTVGLTTARPPWLTVPLGALAGRPFEPAKRSALHGRHHALGADVRWAGDWRRAYHYGDPAAETLAVQRAAGLIDVSTLGKLLVQGPDAGELLDRLYTNRMSNLAPGRIRYGVMVSEAGRITDDGTVGRLDDDAFYVTTTSAGVAAVEQQMAWWLTAWDLDVRVTDVTQGVAAMNLAGPEARTILTQLTDADCSKDGLRYLDARRATVAGVPALILRIGFVGELGYEIHCPAPQAAHLWDALLDAEGVTVTPFGLEPQRVLRLQKLHVIVGQDTDSESTPFNTAMGWAVKFDKEQDFIGRWALEQKADRPVDVELVGFTVPSGEVMAEGAVVLRDGAPSGQVTSARWSPHLGASIGMATVPAELAADGARISISYEGRTYAGVVTAKPFYDPDGEVLRA
ncbi:Sarcosine oxidase subunit alpha [Baekduia alba]|uniref:FAD-dependent oxidoreductase n=1 Tax=Baekduia alba TaxID=2997333 RepID=UPI0023403D5D|nr:FAD-dependent oxidoreductase [Baekduia alba]WCB94901.1 Sarcosine oxidase subunit alpha [Baekduia alba]